MVCLRVVYKCQILVIKKHLGKLNRVVGQVEAIKKMINDQATLY